MRSKFEDPLSKNKSLLGPGQYKTMSTLNETGKYFIAKYHSSGCSKIGNTKRFDDIQILSPGPGSYLDNKITGMNKTGKYFASTYKTININSFSHSPRKHIAE
jgi:hypothetical protein